VFVAAVTFAVTVARAAMMGGKFSAMRAVMTPGTVWSRKVRAVKLLAVKLVGGAAPMTLREMRRSDLVMVPFAVAAMGKVMRRARSMVTGSKVAGTGVRERSRAVLRDHRQCYAIPGLAARIKAGAEMLTRPKMVARVWSAVREMPTVELAAELWAIAVMREAGLRLAVSAAMSKAMLRAATVMAVAVVSMTVMRMMAVLCVRVTWAAVAGMSGVRATSVMPRGMLAAITLLSMFGVLRLRIARALGLIFGIAGLLFSVLFFGFAFVGLVCRQNGGIGFAAQARILVAATATSKAASAGPFQSPLKFLAQELLPLRLLLVGQQAFQLLFGGLASGLHFAERFGTIAVGVLHQRSHLFSVSGLNGFDGLLLVVGEGELLSHRGIGKGRRAGKLQRDLLEPGALFVVQNRVDHLLAGFAAFVKPLRSLFAAGVTQARKSLTLFGGELFDLLDLLFTEFEILLDGLLSEQNGAAGATAATARAALPALLSQRGRCRRDERGDEQ